MASFPPNGADFQAPTDQPQIGLIAQYVKDLSFENPNAPAVYQAQTPPRIDVQFNLGVAAIADDVHEASMKIEVRATGENDQTVFAVELLYAGLFGVRNVPADQLQGFMLAQAPQLLFPFARRIVAETVRDGNFPPLLLDPVDFGAMYMAQAEQAQGLANQEPAGQA
jgi:preprotein translocase subunit SecB